MADTYWRLTIRQPGSGNAPLRGLSEKCCKLEVLSFVKRHYRVSSQAISTKLCTCRTAPTFFQRCELNLSRRGDGHSRRRRQRWHQVCHAPVFNRQRFSLHLCKGGLTQKIEQDLDALASGQDAQNNPAEPQKCAFSNRNFGSRKKAILDGHRLLALETQF